MKISEEQLKKIIQEELSSALKEGEIDENFLKKAAGSLGGFFKGLTRDPTTDQAKLGSFAIQRDRSTPSGKQKPGITKFTQGPSSQSVQSRPTTSATTPSASGTATQTAGPGETVTNSTTQSAAEQPAQTKSQNLNIKVAPPVEDEPEIFDKYSIEKMKTGTEQFKKTFSELSKLLKSQLETFGIEKHVIKQFLGALSTSLNKDLTSITLNEEQDHLKISNLINKYFSGGPEEPNKLSPVKIRNILKMIKNWAEQNSSFVQDEVVTNPGIELPKQETTEDLLNQIAKAEIQGDLELAAKLRDKAENLEESYKTIYNKWQKLIKG
jgi:hypothetical protein